MFKYIKYAYYKFHFNRKISLLQEVEYEISKFMSHFKNSVYIQESSYLNYLNRELDILLLESNILRKKLSTLRNKINKV